MMFILVVLEISLSFQMSVSAVAMIADVLAMASRLLISHK